MDGVVCEGLDRMFGCRKISSCLAQLARPQVRGDDLAEGYKAMGLDALHEQAALGWSGALIGDANHAAL